METMTALPTLAAVTLVAWMVMMLGAAVADEVRR